ncbi:hypothetical protein [Corynebacterium kroppenstedtii]|uniref:hypothetical protein n=1 Tax=Corynebacterium kroppenstedtii TaxID=161879 RepID=UPI00195BAF4A|nr:hypothetical protein [Corynebacterium kroppenstedtii]QRQ64890.1 hypothetical protein I6J23_10310 [Corynebacterium kroppenstedtii]
MVDSDIILTPGEQRVFSRKFRSSLLLFWLPTTMIVTNHRVVVRDHKTFLGFIPLGGREESIPLSSISEVTASWKIYFPQFLLFGFIWFIETGLYYLSVDPTESFVLTGAGAGVWALVYWVSIVLIINSLRSGIYFIENYGEKTCFTITPIQKSLLKEFSDRLTDYIHPHPDGTGFGQSQFDGGQPQGFNAPQGFDGQPQQFGNQQRGFNSSQGFGGQPQQFGNQQRGFNSSQGFGGQQQGFGGQPQQFGNQQRGFNSSQGFGGQQQGFGGSQQGFSTSNQSAQNSNGSQSFNAGQSFGGNRGEQSANQQAGSGQFSNPNQWGQSSPQSSSSTSSSHSVSEESESTLTNEHPEDGDSNLSSRYTNESEKKDSSHD